MNKFSVNDQRINQELHYPIPSGASLSQREAQCFYLLAYGKSMKAIARILKLSPRTIEMYITKIKNKTGISYKSELTQRAIDILLSQHR